MKIFFLNCNKRTDKFLAPVYKWVKRNKPDVIVLAEACYFDCSFDGYYSFVPEDKAYKNALKVFARQKFAVEELNYVVHHDIVALKYPENLQRFRLLNLDFGDWRMTAVYVTSGWYNYLAMRQIQKAMLEFSPDLVLGDFNSGYVNDDLQAPSSIIFLNEFLFFNEFENLRYFDPKKNSGEYSFKGRIGGHKFRIDHCFVRQGKKYEVSYLQEFLDNGISDHAGVLVVGE